MRPTRSVLSRSAVGAAGGLLLLVGVPIFADPVAYEAAMEVAVPADPTLLSDFRAMAGSLIAFAALLLGAAANPRLLPTAATAGALLFGSYGLSRLVSMAVDGMPSETLIGAAVLELLVGSLLAAVAWVGGAR
jgi:hypothetical protein